AHADGADLGRSQQLPAIRCDQAGDGDDAVLRLGRGSPDAFQKEGQPAFPVAAVAHGRQPPVVLDLMPFQVTAQVHQRLGQLAPVPTSFEPATVAKQHADKHTVTCAVVDATVDVPDIIAVRGDAAPHAFAVQGLNTCTGNPA